MTIEPIHKNSFIEDIPVNPYANFLELLEKPARYIGGEKFSICKNWREVDVKMALCFPDVYEIGMSHLGFKILYNLLNQEKDILAERVFAPWIDMEEKLHQFDLPLVTLENFRPLKDFDVVGFSLQYEMTYTNILNMLDLGGIPLWSKDRSEEHPLVCVGGPCATHPEPLADFVDFVVVGDGEGLTVRMLREISRLKKDKKNRDEILLQLASWPGIYVPKFYQTKICEKSLLEVVTGPVYPHLPSTIKRFFVQNLADYPFPVKSPIPHATAIFDNFSVELARGCTEGCRFCQAGMIYRPVRERDPIQVINTVMEGLKAGGFQQASLTCLSTADYSAVTPLVIDLLDKMKGENATLGIASLRAYGLDESVLDKMAEVKNTALTFAPEAGTERMRKVINKNITEEDMLATAEKVFARNFNKMKLYFMIGLPTETDEDVQGIMETAKKAKEVAFARGVRNPNITVSVSSFVPKPHTPFQWASMITLEEIERKQEYLFQLSRDYRLNFRRHFSKTSFFEGVVARGDRRVGKVIHRAYMKGARFDGWMDCFNFSIWKDSLNEENLDPALYLGAIRLDGGLPWDHIDVGLEDKFLEREWKKALHDRFSPPCGKPNGQIVHHSNLQSLEKTHDEEKKKLVCYHCGIKCDLTEMVDERRKFLKSLNAIESLPYVRPSFEGKSVLSFREKRGQEVGVKYRVKFAKIGPISFISHLDLQKIVTRIFKRAQLEVLYSEGFNQRPLFSFGPALSLGISSLDEYFDVRVPKFFNKNETEILSILNEASEKGIIFYQIDLIPHKVVSIQDATESFNYVFPLKEFLDEASLTNLKEQLMKGVFEVMKRGKEGEAPSTQVINMEEHLLDFSKIDLRELPYKDILQEVYPKTRLKMGINLKIKVTKGSTLRILNFHQIFSQCKVSVDRPLKLSTNLKEEGVYVEQCVEILAGSDAN